MKEEYRRIINQQHAPQELIEKTLNKVKATDSRKVNIRMKLRIGYALSACVVLALLVCFIYPRTEFHYMTEDNSLLKNGMLEEKGEKISVDEYETYLSIPLRNMILDAKLINSKILVEYDEKHKTICNDEAILLYNWKGQNLIVQLSKTKNPAPESFKKAKVTTLHHIDYQLVISNDGNKFMAACEKEGIYYLYICNNWLKKDFETFLLAN